MFTQNVSLSNCRKAGPITLIGPGPTVILLIGPLIQIASLLLGRAGGMLQAVIIFGLRFAFFTHISGKKRTVSKYVR